MKLYLVQHGEAVAEAVNPEKPLSEKGKADVEKVARFLKNGNTRVDIIWHSTKTRAIQTAEILGKVISPKDGLLQREGLAPDDPIDKIVLEINAMKANLMIVGHLPFLKRLASLLLLSGADSSLAVSFHQGGALCLEKIQKEWTLVLSIAPDMIKGG